ncbi:MAG: hypothetical protein KC933_24810 [Myxococcales bacterium]|nr:hypothetical protein [Myxococcales bacterium]
MRSVHLAPLALMTLIPASLGWLEAPQKAPTLHGVWSQAAPVEDGDPVRFYYFHPGGIGLFRYGRQGLTFTRSFRYQVEGKELALTFTKSGEAHRLGFTLTKDALVLKADPALGGEQRYTRRGAGSGHTLGSEHPLARMWKHVTADTSGQERFHMYQLEAPALDGRGVGWYHEGDYSDWSTEALTYRRVGDQLVLQFSLRGETQTTAMTLGKDEAGEAYLELGEDPRNFWHPRRYLDAGPGFSVSLEGEPMPYYIAGHGAGASEGHGCPHAR